MWIYRLGIVVASLGAALASAVGPAEVRCPFTGARLTADNKNPHGPGHPGHAASSSLKTAASVHAAFGDAPVALSRIQDGRRFRVTGVPPARVPLDAELLHALTRGGRVALENRYIDDTLGGVGRRVRYERRHVDGAVAHATREIEALRRSRAAAPGADFGSFAATIPSRLWPLAALVEHARDIKGKRAAVFGSLALTEEATLLALGAAHVTVIDYQPLVVEHPNVTTVTVAAARAAACSRAAEAGLTGARAPGNDTMTTGSTPGAGDAAAVPAGFSPFDFDIAASFSSFDHDGLGRYGDPIAADGDLLAMDELRCGWLHEAPAPRQSTKRTADAAADAGSGAGADDGDEAALANATETASVSVDAHGAVVSPDEAAAARNAAAERERRELRGPRLLFLSLPVGADALVWNQHRRYGSARLPLMLEGFTPVRTVGWEEARLSTAAPAASKSYEPVWVLLPQPPAAAVCETARRALCAPLLPLPNVPAAPGAPSSATVAAAAAATVGSA